MKTYLTKDKNGNYDAKIKSKDLNQALEYLKLLPNHKIVGEEVIIDIN